MNYFRQLKMDSINKVILFLDRMGWSDSRIEVVDKFFKADKNNFGPQIGFAYSPKILKW